MTSLTENHAQEISVESENKNEIKTELI
jgi:hypothetical protein